MDKAGGGAGGFDSRDAHRRVELVLPQPYEVLARRRLRRQASGPHGVQQEHPSENDEPVDRTTGAPWSHSSFPFLKIC